LVVACCWAVECLDRAGGIDPGGAGISLEEVDVVLVLALLALKLGAHFSAGSEEVGRLVEAAGLERVGDQARGDVALALSFS